MGISRLGVSRLTCVSLVDILERNLGHRLLYQSVEISMQWGRGMRDHPRAGAWSERGNTRGSIEPQLNRKRSIQ